MRNFLEGKGNHSMTNSKTAYDYLFGILTHSIGTRKRASGQERHLTADDPPKRRSTTPVVPNKASQVDHPVVPDKASQFGHPRGAEQSSA